MLQEAITSRGSDGQLLTRRAVLKGGLGLLGTGVASHQLFPKTADASPRVQEIIHLSRFSSDINTSPGQPDSLTPTELHAEDLGPVFDMDIPSDWGEPQTYLGGDGIKKIRFISSNVYPDGLQKIVELSQTASGNISSNLARKSAVGAVNLMRNSSPDSTDGISVNDISFVGDHTGYDITSVVPYPITRNPSNYHESGVIINDVLWRYTMYTTSSKKAAEKDGSSYVEALRKFRPYIDFSSEILPYHIKLPEYWQHTVEPYPDWELPGESGITYNSIPGFTDPHQNPDYVKYDRFVGKLTPQEQDQGVTVDFTIRTAVPTQTMNEEIDLYNQTWQQWPSTTVEDPQIVEVGVDKLSGYLVGGSHEKDTEVLGENDVSFSFMSVLVDVNDLRIYLTARCVKNQGQMEVNRVLQYLQIT